MKLLSYLQKIHHITRREFFSMLQEQVLLINDTPVTDFSQEINAWDVLKIKLPKKQIYEETISSLPTYRPKLILFNKPTGYVVSKDDPHNKTIYDVLPKHRREQYYYIGRLDKDSSGLLLLTNDTQLVDYYENPKNGVYKVYEVVIDKGRKAKDSKKAKFGLRVTEQGDVAQEGQQAELLSAVSVSYHYVKNQHLAVITLNEWKKRHIRRLLRALWYKVYSLQRIKIGKRLLWTLKPGKRRIETKALRS